MTATLDPRRHRPSCSTPPLKVTLTTSPLGFQWRVITCPECGAVDVQPPRHDDPDPSTDPTQPKEH